MFESCAVAGGSPVNRRREGVRDHGEEEDGAPDGPTIGFCMAEEMVRPQAAALDLAKCLGEQFIPSTSPVSLIQPCGQGTDFNGDGSTAVNSRQSNRLIRPPLTSSSSASLIAIGG